MNFCRCSTARCIPRCIASSEEGGSSPNGRLRRTVIGNSNITGVNPHLLLGGELVGWSKTENGATVTAGNTTLSAFYYPKPASGLFLNGGVGFSRVEASAGGSSAGETGPGFTLGAGYDIRVGTNVSITPIADWVWGAPQSGFNHNFFNFAVGVTFH